VTGPTDATIVARISAVTENSTMTPTNLQMVKTV